MKKLILATRNIHKVEELQVMLEGLYEVIPFTTIDDSITWEETGGTFQKNAEIKARAIAEKIRGSAILSDDSGLSVSALGGEPGVYSSRYSGVEGNDAANNKKLLRELERQNISDKRAYFSCVLCFINESGTTQFFEGKLEGSITMAPKGEEGFGYDPLFIPKGESKTVAELGAATKKKISHRARAIAQFVEQVKSERS